jgi:hypothetical protein
VVCSVRTDGHDRLIEYLEVVVNLLVLVLLVLLVLLLILLGDVWLFELYVRESRT